MARDRPSREAGEEQVGEEVREGEWSDSQVENQERRQSQCKGLRPNSLGQEVKEKEESGAVCTFVLAYSSLRGAREEKAVCWRPARSFCCREREESRGSPGERRGSFGGTLGVWGKEKLGILKLLAGVGR